MRVGNPVAPRCESTSGMGICTRNGILHSVWGLRISGGRRMVSLERMKHWCLAVSFVGNGTDLWISQTSILALRGRRLGSDCRNKRFSVNGQSDPKITPLGHEQDKLASPRTIPLSSLTTEVGGSAAGVSLATREGSI